MKEELDDFMFEDEESGIIDFGKYWDILKRHWKQVMWWTVGGFALGCLIAIGTPHQYSSVAELAPELSSNTMSRLTSLSSLMGFSSTMLGTTDAVYPMVYPDLSHSPSFVAELFKMPVTTVVKKDTVKTDLLDYMMNYRKKNVVAEVAGFPMKAAFWAKDLIIKKELPEEDDTEVDPAHFTKGQERAYRMLCKCVKVNIEKKTLLVTISVMFEDRQIAADLCRCVEDNLKAFVTRYRTEKTIHDRDYYKGQFEKAKDEYYEAQSRYSRYVDSHQGVVLQSVGVESDRLRNEMTLKYQVYSAMTQQLNDAEAKVQLETPVFAEIVSPTVPHRSVDSRKKKALSFALAGLIIGVFSVCTKKEKELSTE